MFCLCWLVACNDDSTEAPAPDGDTETDSATESEPDTEQEKEVETYAFPAGGCGMEVYTMLPSSEVGAVLEHRAIAFWDMSASSIDGLLASAGYDFLSPVPYGVRIYQYRYTTQHKGKAVEATALLALPKSETGFDTALPFILHPHGTSGFSDPCAPSRSNIEGPAIPALLAAQGYMVVAPDFIGMNGFGAASTERHAYLLGEQVAVGSWDAVRAAEKLLANELDEDLTFDGRVVPWGGSQGGHASLFCELYAPYYAPEYDVPAVISMTPPLDLSQMVSHSLASIQPGTGLLAISLIAMNIWYDNQIDLHDYFTNEDPYFFADNAESIIYPTEVCGIDGIEGEKVSDLFNETCIQAGVAEDWDAIAKWKCYLDRNSPATTNIERKRVTPTLIVFGEKDTLVYTSFMMDGFDKMCTDGYKLDYLECAGAEHVQASLWSLPNQRDWLKARLDGVPQDTEKVCTRPAPVCCGGSTPEQCAGNE